MLVGILIGFGIPALYVFMQILRSQHKPKEHTIGLKKIRTNFTLFLVIATSLVLVNNANFNTIGYIVIGSERIYYQTKTVSGSNMTLGVLSRAENDTVQASHSAGDAVRGHRIR